MSFWSDPLGSISSALGTDGSGSGIIPDIINMPKNAWGAIQDNPVAAAAVAAALAYVTAGGSLALTSAGQAAGLTEAGLAAGTAEAGAAVAAATEYGGMSGALIEAGGGLGATYGSGAAALGLGEFGAASAGLTAASASPGVVAGAAKSWLPGISNTNLLNGALGLYGANQQAGAARDAANLQAGAAQAGLGESARQFNLGLGEQQKQFAYFSKILTPFINSGTNAINQQSNLIGLNGNDAQQQAIDAIQKSSQFNALAQQGEAGILQNASATGGLRGGNVQGALAQFRPMLLQQLIDNQYTKLGGVAALGQNSAVGVGNAGVNTGANIAQQAGQFGVNSANLLQQQGAAQAGGALASGKQAQDYVNLISSGFGFNKGIGGI